MTNRCHITRLGRFNLDLTLYQLWKISKLTSLYKPGFVWEQQRGEEKNDRDRGEEITTASRQKAASESRGSTRVAVHSSSGGRETSLSRDSDGRDCVQSAESGHVWRSRGRQQRQGLAGRGCRSSISGKYYAEGAAVQEKTATSGTCWLRL